MLPINYWLLALSLTTSLSAKKISLDSLSLEEKIGQILMVSVQAETINNSCRTLINDLHIGGIIYYSWANGLHSPEEVALLSSGLQTLASANRIPLPLIIAIDHEGGHVHRFEKGFTHFPPAYAYSLANTHYVTEQCACAMGKELRSVGITLNLAPVVDIMSNPNNPIIGARAFDSTPESVITHARAFLKGLHQAGCMTSLKHFPGHGDTDADSHLALPLIHKTIEQLKTNELAPFYALAQETDSCMTAHLMIPALDDTTCSTLSKKTLDLLRNEAHFDGVIISDSLVMQGITDLCDDLAESAILAFNAGCDLLLIGGRCLVGTRLQEATIDEIARVHKQLLHAVQTGRISKDRLDESVSRILQLKERTPPNNITEHNNIDWYTHQRRASTVTQQALDALSKNDLSLSSTFYQSLKDTLSHLMELYDEKNL